MEEINRSLKSYRLSFQGSGKDFFGIVVVNWLLTVLTLGLYYPWAKAKQLQYIYGASALNNDNFTFHGTGKEMFKGFIKAVIIFILIYAVSGIFAYLKMPMVGVIFLYLAIIALVPLIIHGSYRYRMSRTSWRGIRFGYRGDRNTLVTSFYKWIMLTIVTIGIYGAWMTMHLRKYVLDNVRFGNLAFNYEGDGTQFFILNLKGYFLSLITLGIYTFWWQKDLFAYYIDNLSIHHDGKRINMKSTATGGDFFGLIIVNLLIIVFTLGLGYAWVVTRSLDFIFSKIEMTGDIDLDAIEQTEDIFTDATGEDMGDMLDFGFVV